MSIVHTPVSTSTSSQKAPQTAQEAQREAIYQAALREGTVTITFTIGELVALNRFANTWITRPDHRPEYETASEWRAIHKIRHPDYRVTDLPPEDLPLR